MRYVTTTFFSLCAGLFLAAPAVRAQALDISFMYGKGSTGGLLITPYHEVSPDNNSYADGDGTSTLYQFGLEVRKSFSSGRMITVYTGFALYDVYEGAYKPEDRILVGSVSGTAKMLGVSYEFSFDPLFLGEVTVLEYSAGPLLGYGKSRASSEFEDYSEVDMYYPDFRDEAGVLSFGVTGRAGIRKGDFSGSVRIDTGFRMPVGISREHSGTADPGFSEPADGKGGLFILVQLGLGLRAAGGGN